MVNESITIVLASIPLLMRGALMTGALWLSSAVMSVVLGGVWGFLMCDNITVPIFSRVVTSLTFILRAVPFYVQLLLVYFGLPALLGIPLSAMAAGILSLGICSGAYVANIVRTGINAISPGQWQACYVLGYSKRATLVYCIIPQMVRIVFPALINEGESLLKSTALISSIGVLELTRAGMNVVSRYMNPLSMYGAVALFYLFFSLVLLLCGRWAQRRMNYVGN